MQTYSEFAPTPLDLAGAFLPEQGDWFVVPTSQTRDSDHLSESNFAAALERLGGESDDVEVHRFGHWGPGWFEIILVRPNTRAATIADEIEARLAQYPALDESDLCEREYRAYNESWESWGATDFVRALVRKLELDEATEERLEDSDKGKLQEFFESLNECGDYIDDGAPSIRRSVDNATMADVQDFLDSNTDATDATQDELPL